MSERTASSQMSGVGDLHERFAHIRAEAELWHTDKLSHFLDRLACVVSCCHAAALSPNSSVRRRNHTERRYPRADCWMFLIQVVYFQRFDECGVPIVAIFYICLIVLT